LSVRPNARWRLLTAVLNRTSLPQSQVMARSLRVAILGLSIGFLLAGLLGLTQPGNHPLASALFVPAGIGIAVLGVLLVVDALRDRRWMDLEDVDGPEFIPTYGAPAWSARQAAADAAAARAPAAAAAADAAAARIAELEARLAIEEQELHNVVDALGETDPFASSAADSAPHLAEVDSDAAEMEPLLRQEVLETLIELVGRKEDVIREFEALTTSSSAPGRPIERRVAPKKPVAVKQPAASTKPASHKRAASEPSQLQPVRRRRKPVKPKAPLDERAERVGKRDLRRGRARHTQQVGRADEDG
jgi:hypothetical protein